MSEKKVEEWLENGELVSENGADDEESSLVQLVDEEGNEYTFELLEIFPAGDEEYVALFPLMDGEGDKALAEEDFALVFMRIEGEGDEESLVEIADEEELGKVVEAWDAFVDNLEQNAADEAAN